MSNLSFVAILEKKEFAALYGGNADYNCTCWNDDGTKTILPGGASSPEDCAAKCLKLKEGTVNKALLVMRVYSKPFPKNTPSFFKYCPLQKV